jgi:serine/threonine protein kinase
MTPSTDSAFAAKLAGQLQDLTSVDLYLPISSNITSHMTLELLNSYKLCNPNFRAAESIPKRVLTQPNEPSHVGSKDNVEGNLICTVRDELTVNGEGGETYIILDLLGQGTFGQVFRCQRKSKKDIVAVKIIKNKPAYRMQSIIEIKILEKLNRESGDCDHVIQLLDSFECFDHVCLVFELLDISLLDMLGRNQYRGLPISLVQSITRQILSAMELMQSAGIIHCDLKPENVLLCPKTSDDVVADQGGDARRSAAEKLDSLKVKVIDFGSACFEGNPVFSYIQSRFYRSPEVLIGFPYDGSIDMWSLGCMVCEMLLGLPLFPGVSQHNQLTRIIEMFGMPSDIIIENGKNAANYFKLNNDASMAGQAGENYEGIALGGLRDILQKSLSKENKRRYRFKTPEEYAIDNKTTVPIAKKYLKYSSLDDLILRGAQKAAQGQGQLSELTRRKCLLHFVKGLLRINPWERWTARQASSHPFITGEVFTGDFKPLPDPIVTERVLSAVRNGKLSSRVAAEMGFQLPLLSATLSVTTSLSSSPSSTWTPRVAMPSPNRKSAGSTATFESNGPSSLSASDKSFGIPIVNSSTPKVFSGSSSRNDSIMPTLSSTLSSRTLQGNIGGDAVHSKSNAHLMSLGTSPASAVAALGSNAFNMSPSFFGYLDSRMGSGSSATEEIQFSPHRHFGTVSMSEHDPRPWTLHHNMNNQQGTFSYLGGISVARNDAPASLLQRTETANHVVTDFGQAMKRSGPDRSKYFRSVQQNHPQFAPPLRAPHAASEGSISSNYFTNSNAMNSSLSSALHSRPIASNLMPASAFTDGLGATPIFSSVATPGVELAPGSNPDSLGAIARSHDSYQLGRGGGNMDMYLGVHETSKDCMFADAFANTASTAYFGPIEPQSKASKQFNNYVQSNQKDLSTFAQREDRRPLYIHDHRNSHHRHQQERGPHAPGSFGSSTSIDRVSNSGLGIQSSVAGIVAGTHATDPSLVSNTNGGATRNRVPSVFM